MSVMKCARTGPRAHARATQAVKCAVAFVVSAVINICVIELCPSFPHCRPDFHCCNTVSVHLTRFSQSLFTCFHCILTAF